jgi:hypothetical protein
MQLLSEFSGMWIVSDTRRGAMNFLFHSLANVPHFGGKVENVLFINHQSARSLFL